MHVSMILAPWLLSSDETIVIKYLYVGQSATSTTHNDRCPAIKDLSSTFSSGTNVPNVVTIPHQNIDWSFHMDF